MGSGAGMGQKPDDFRTVSLCKAHHQQQHTVGEETFWRTYRAAAGQTVDQLMDAFAKASPKAREIAQIKRERDIA